MGHGKGVHGKVLGYAHVLVMGWLVVLPCWSLVDVHARACTCLLRVAPRGRGPVPWA